MASPHPPEQSAKEKLMPVDPNAPVRISAFNWVPPFAQGHVRDLRPRWALEEAAIPYAVRKLDARAERPADYFQEQPFGQVPSYHDDTVSLFESGAIVLHIGRDCEMLLPADPAARARSTAWLIAALNSVEPFLMQLATIDIFATGEEWARLRRPGVIEMIDKRLSRLSDALGDKPYLDGDRFTAGDLMMTTVLRIIDGKGLLDRYPNLVAYKARCQARPAFEAALAAQIADFEERQTARA
jgi:glutathione S-transferase